jgi:hypothetical protein
MSRLPYTFFTSLTQLIEIMRAISFAGKQKMNSGGGMAREKGATVAAF